MKASRSSCISSIRCTACAGACRVCSTKCTRAEGQPTKDDGAGLGGCPRIAPMAPTVPGQIEMVSLGLASARVAEGGALRVLAQTGPRRHPMFADVPTTAELGMPDVRMDTWFGLLAPPDTPEPIVARLVRESDAVVNQ